MSKSFVAAKSAFLLAAPFALCAILPSSAAGSPPLLSGTYLITINTFCQPTVEAEVAKDTTRRFALGRGSNASLAGTIAFAQGATAGTGTAKTKLTVDSGSLFLQAGNETGVDDAPLAQSVGAKEFMFTQTATTLSLAKAKETDTYNVYYGAAGKTGIVSEAVFAGLDSQGCGNNGIVIRK